MPSRGLRRRMREYTLVFLVACAACFLLSGVARKVALRFGALAQVRDRDVHAIPIPYFGGIAMLFGIAAGFLVASQLPFLGQQPTVEHDAFWVLVAATVICAVGVLDDLFELRPLAKVAGQVLAAGIVTAQGVRMLWIPINDTTVALDPSISIAITVFFIVLCTNAINLVDGLDGLATGVVLIGASAFFLYSYLLTAELDMARATTAAVITAAVAGACLGFLPHNFAPAQMFMGDSGAMLLGLLLASSTISLTGQLDGNLFNTGGSNLLPAYLPLIMPLAIMALPLFDLASVYVRRTMRGVWWFRPDKQHLHHRLLERGHTKRRAVILMYGWSGLLSYGAIAIGLTQRWEAAVACLAVAVVLIVVTLRKPKPTPEDGASLAQA